MTYMIDDANGLCFMAEYGLTKKNPASNAGLDGFCQLLFKIVPSKLNEVVENLIAPHYSHDDKQAFE